MDVPDARIAIGLELVPASSKKVLDGTKVFLANVEVFAKLFPRMREQRLSSQQSGIFPLPCVVTEVMSRVLCHISKL